MSKSYIVEIEDETQLIVEIGVNSTGAAVITTKHPKYLTPYEEPDLDAIRNEAYEKGVQDTKQHWVDAPRSCAYRVGYEKGLNDAWDAARKILLSKKDGGLLDYDERKAVFGYGNYFLVLKKCSASEAVEKIRQYEQEQEEIKVGDEVIGIYSSGEQTKPFVITKLDSNYYFGIYSDSGKPCQGGLKLQKTGRHFPEIAEAAEVLRKLQEEKE